MLKNRDRIAALDFVRIISMLSVIILHVTSAYIFLPSHISLGGINLAYMMNQAARYCVPLFFLLSGLSLALSYRGASYGTFLLSRAKKIVLPYLFWASIYYLLQTDVFVLKDYLRSILWGTAAPHLYFIVALVQLYILFVPLYRLMKKRPTLVLLSAFLIALFFQWGIYLVVFDVHLFPMSLRPYILKTFLPWLFVFVLGMFLAQTQEIWKNPVSQYRFLWRLSLGLFAAFYVVDSSVTQSYDLSVKPILFLYVPLAFGCFFGIGDWISKSKRCDTVVRFLSKHSMTVFFCHIIVLNRLRGTGRFDLGMEGMLTLCLAVIALSIVLAVLFDLVIEGLKKLMKAIQSGKGAPSP